MTRVDVEFGNAAGRFPSGKQGRLHGRPGLHDERAGVDVRPDRRVAAVERITHFGRIFSVSSVTRALRPSLTMRAVISTSLLSVKALTPRASKRGIWLLTRRRKSAHRRRSRGVHPNSAMASRRGKIMYSKCSGVPMNSAHVHPCTPIICDAAFGRMCSTESGATYSPLTSDSLAAALSGVSGTGSKLYIFLMGENPLIARGCVCGLAWYQSK